MTRTGNYTFAVACGGATTPAAASVTLGSGISVPTGSSAPGVTQLNFGTVPVGTTVTKTFTVSNTGGTDLLFSEFDSSSIFSMPQQPTSPIHTGGSSTFIIAFTPTAGQSYSSVITLKSNDPATPYTFTVSGTGLASTTATALKSLSLNPGSVQGGSSATGIVEIDRAAPTGGATVAIALSNATGVATAPTSLTVPSGQTTASFTIPTAGVSSSTNVGVAATLGGTANAVLTVVPAASGCSIQSLQIAPDPVQEESPPTGTVILNQPAPSGGASVTLSHTNPTADSIPTSVTVNAGFTTATFNITTSTVAAAATDNVTATLGGTATVQLVVSPSATPTVYITGMSLTPNPVVGSSSVTGW